MFCASVAIPADDPSFDFRYLATQHAPMFAGLLGENCVRVEVHRGLSDHHGAPPSSFAGAAYFWVTSEEAYGAVLQEHLQALDADVANFATMAPVRGWADIVILDDKAL
jgi:uncharacterized protein (TIGR02118 family)